MGRNPCHLALDRTGKYLLVANRDGASAVLPIDNDGKLNKRRTNSSGR